MALENFRQVKLQMNKADGSILKTIYAKEDDYNGRELVVQITDDGIVRDLTGADVNLGWKNLKVGNQGLEPFTAIDSAQGTYKVVYPTEMLNKGEILCTIQLIYGGSMIHSRNFKIIIESNPVDSDAVESDNNFSVLQDALIRISTLEEGYAPRLNAVENRAADNEDGIDSLINYVGDLTTLATTEKTNIVDALNEIDTNHKSHLAEKATDDVHGLAGAVIVEVGSNNDGRYIRFGDGTQICTQRVDDNDQAIGDAYGSLYIGLRTWTFPKPFIDGNAIVSPPFFKWGNSASWGACNSVRSVDATMRIYDVNAKPVGTMTQMGFFAIGRWK